MNKNRYLCSLTFVDNFGEVIQLSSFNDIRVKYFYFEDNVWTPATDFNIDYTLNVLWVRLPKENYSSKFLLNIAVGVEQVYTTGVQDVEWTKLPNPNTYTLTLVGVLTDNAEGFAPRVIDGYWYEYSQEYGGLYNTGIKAEATVISETIEVVDKAEKDNLNPITSNAVYNIKTELNNKFINNNQLISQNRTLINNLNTEVNALKNKNYSVKVNNNTIEADENGLIDLGEIGGGTMTPDNNKMVETMMEINNKLIPYGSTYYDYGDGNLKITSLSSPNSYIQMSLNSDGWIKIANLSGQSKATIQYTIHSSTYEGELYIEKNGYNYIGKTTSTYISSAFKIYQSGISAWLVCKGNSHVSSSVIIEYDRGMFESGKVIPESEIQYNTFIDIPYFITTADQNPDYITIDESLYETYATDMVITNYNVECTTKFKFQDELNYPVAIRFNAINNDIKITVEDTNGDSYNFTTESETLGAGDIATLFFQSKVDDSYFWTYSKMEDFEVKDNKTQSINSSSTSEEYPSAKAVYDALSTYTVDLNIKNGEGDYSLVQKQRDLSPEEVENLKNEAGRAAVALGFANKALGQNSFTCGVSNKALDRGSSVLGGQLNEASGEFSSVINGSNCISKGNYSIAAGRSIQANNSGEFSVGTFNNSIEKTSDNTIADATQFSVGIGKKSNQRINGLEVKQNGDIWFYSNSGEYVKLQDCLNDGLEIILNGETYSIVNGTIDLGKTSSSIKLNGSDYLPNSNGEVNIGNLVKQVKINGEIKIVNSSGLVDLGTIEGGSGTISDVEEQWNATGIGSTHYQYTHKMKYKENGSSKIITTAPSSIYEMSGTSAVDVVNATYNYPDQVPSIHLLKNYVSERLSETNITITVE